MTGELFAGGYVRGNNPDKLLYLLGSEVGKNELKKTNSRNFCAVVVASSCSENVSIKALSPKTRVEPLYCW